MKWNKHPKKSSSVMWKDRRKNYTRILVFKIRNVLVFLTAGVCWYYPTLCWTNYFERNSNVFRQSVYTLHLKIGTFWFLSEKKWKINKLLGSNKNESGPETLSNKNKKSEGGLIGTRKKDQVRIPFNSNLFLISFNTF